MDGYQVARRLRDQGVRASIVAVTSAKRQEYGIDGYVGKPVSMTQLKDLLANYAVEMTA